MTEQEDVRDFRLTQRYIFDHPVTANYDALDVRVTNISTGGLQIEHADPLKLRIESRISIPFSSPVRAAELRGEVVWSHLSGTSNAEGKNLYRSGVRLEKTPENALAVERLLQAYHAIADGESLKRKREILRRKREAGLTQTPPRTYKPVIEPDRMLMIRQLSERLKRNPVELNLLAQRGRSALADRVDRTLPSDEVLAVWEYLEHGISLEEIEQTLSKK